MEITAEIVTAFVAAGMGAAFIAADYRSRTSWILGLFFVLLGASITANVCAVRAYRAGAPHSWPAFAALADTAVLLVAHEWILRIRRTIPARGLRTSFGDRMLRVAQVLALVYGGLALALPDLRVREFLGVMREAGPGASLGFWVFFLPFGLSVLGGIASIVLVLNRKPDPAEKVRLVALSAAAPPLAAGALLPDEWNVVASVVGLVIFLIGALRYHVFQGQRGQFLGRFLSPQVAEIVRSQGLEAAMRERTVELSVVNCDLRGFTALSEATSSVQVVQILREYYEAVGRVAAEFGATIKDHVGDGILLLVGAPIPYDDHAGRAVRLAERIRDEVSERTSAWREAGFELGIGIGVASGFVTVGVIDGAGRLEYVAVGPAVNLASRLCDRAAPGEVLVDRRTVELVGAGDPASRFESRAPVDLKGFSGAVQPFALAPLQAGAGAG